MSPTTATPPRRRMPREARTRQLLDVAWTLVGDEGTDALTLGRLADQAGVTKPLVYDHFGTRNGLLAALYQDYDERQTAIFDRTVAAAEPTLRDKACAIASGYVACVLTQGREISGVLAALSGSAELAAVKRQYQERFIEKCAAVLAPFAGAHGVARSDMWAILGAADSVSDAAATGDIPQAQATRTLERIILAMITGDAETPAANAPSGKAQRRRA
ncbi:TetR/AcrR family transcriptional regulator [Pandoraea pulmonicola]|uniref:TetR family transcriptional regulator n=1 Tax=Pandoraea pulmonicola TaxID=93221 RepID=A0AAJ4ZAE4_PANPU|nr:TetR/AcrR family transcriptional regulator [Pandoraea pulmonicola]APD13373.1 TetR family transcriptional regulator [Pandoraea pulmonicola]SUA89666.1 transcriptional regulator BetI [Pandoraea pulmonicola]